MEMNPTYCNSVTKKHLVMNIITLYEEYCQFISENQKKYELKYNNTMPYIHVSIDRSFEGFIHFLKQEYEI